MIVYLINFFIAILLGSMIFFMAVVSPSVFATLSSNASSKFLRTIFPRMFLFGFIIAVLTLIFSFKNNEELLTYFDNFNLNLSKKTLNSFIKSVSKP